jgi:type II secretory pathway component GspD/PulD (secretin)
MRLESNQIIVAGGLLEEETRKNKEVGFPFMNQEKKRIKRELVILLKATILNNFRVQKDECPEWLHVV